MFAIKEGSSARCEVLLVEPDRHGTWWALVRPARRLPRGARLRLGDGTRFEVVETAAAGRRRLAFEDGVDALACARRHGMLPLPPYIQRSVEAGDRDAYQTVYARVDGSVAAPTAGLHFTPALFAALRARDIDWVDVVLHIGPGTFEPVRCKDPRDHVMHWERFEAEFAAVERVRAQRRCGGRVVAVGTTATRVLESVAAWEDGDDSGAVEVQESGDALRGRTRLFIHAPYRWRSVDALLTNFHLPRSTLLLLVDAFAGGAGIRAAYAWAVERRFRFFSYGDAMLID
jgi:S-adenosylmethionine:tRNA ribosyltransferase-isomerase